MPHVISTYTPTLGCAAVLGILGNLLQLDPNPCFSRPMGKWWLAAMCCYCVVVRISLCMSVLVFVCVFACVHELLSVFCVAAATFFWC